MGNYQENKCKEHLKEPIRLNIDVCKIQILNHSKDNQIINKIFLILSDSLLNPNN